MKMTVSALRELEFPRARRHQEKFVSLGGNPFGDVDEVLAASATLADADDHEDTDEPAVSGPIAVEVELDGEHHSFDDWSGQEPLLEFLESKGLAAPFSCRQGQCSACACLVLEGEVALARTRCSRRRTSPRASGWSARRAPPPRSCGSPTTAEPAQYGVVRVRLSARAMLNGWVCIVSQGRPAHR